MSARSPVESQALPGTVGASTVASLAELVTGEPTPESSAPNSRAQRLVPYSGAAEPPDNTRQDRPAKLRGLRREVYALTGSAAPPLAPRVALQSRLPAASAQVHYAKRPFSNPAHPAGAAFQLWHWERHSLTQRKDAEASLTPEEGEAASAVYPFARFGKKLETLRYTDEEYSRYLATMPVQGSREPWTKEETDTLFQLAERFNLQFVVMADRWSVFSPSPKRKRSVNELKDRYYTVVRSLAQARAVSDPGFPHSSQDALQKHCRAMLANPYDIEYEDRRKAQCEEQCRRPRSELLREEAVVQQAQEILRARRLKQRERRRLERLFRRALPAPPTIPYAEAAASLETVQRTEIPGGQSASWASTAASSAGSQEAPPNIARTASNVVSAASAAVASRRPRRASHLAVFVRSSMMLAPVSQSQRVQRQVDQMLDELGVGIRPTPTREICEAFDALRQEILVLIELQRLLKRKEDELRAVRQQNNSAPAEHRARSKRRGKRDHSAE
jgi:DNA methyltransferase 1-associated protein 1